MMDDILTSYNEGIRLLQMEQFEEAAFHLEKVARNFPHFKPALWALGLIDILLGFPHRALGKWSECEGLNVETYAMDMEMVRGKLPYYEKLYSQYNQAINYIKKQQFQEAAVIFEMLFSLRTELPLPLECYKGVILTKIMDGNVEELDQVISSFPIYVQNSMVIRELKEEIQKVLDGQKIEAASTIETVPLPSGNRSLRRNMLYGLGLIASMLIGVTGMWLINDGKSTEQLTVSQEKSDSNNQATEKVTLLDAEITRLNKEKRNLEKELETKIEESTNKSQLLMEANINQNTLVAQAGFNTYQKGLDEYNIGHYENASNQLERSHELQSNEYFSDDSLFFLIKSKQKLNERESALTLCDQFLKQDSQHYLASPLRDDVLLEKARLLIDSGDSTGAREVLELVVSEYQQNWTGREAKIMINNINGGS